MRTQKQQLSVLRGGKQERTRANHVLRGSDHTCETVQQRRTATAAVQVWECLYISQGSSLKLAAVRLVRCS